MAAFEAAGDPDALPRRRRAVAAAEALLPPRVQPAADPGAARRDARARAGVAVRRAAQGVEARPGARRADHHPGAVRGLLRRSATRRCSRTPPRSTPTAPGSTMPARAAAGGRGRPRTSSWSGATSSPRPPRGRPVRRHPGNLRADLMSTLHMSGPSWCSSRASPCWPTRSPRGSNTGLAGLRRGVRPARGRRRAARVQPGQAPAQGAYQCRLGSVRQQGRTQALSRARTVSAAGRPGPAPGTRSRRQRPAAPREPRPGCGSGRCR